MTHSRLTVAFLCLGFTLPAVATTAGQGTTCKLQLSSTPENPRGKRKVFSARQIVDLNFDVVVRSREPVDGLTLRVFTPLGHLYQEMDVPVAEAGSGEQARDMAGYPFPVKVRRTWSEGEPETATAGWKRPKRVRRVLVEGPSLPVAGTYITDHSLYGRWRVEAWPDGSSSPCQARFKITR
jgi:hypothetical protein